ncbi:MAG TPA: hypothetical protein VES69_00730, partial [Pyrinomonadaceae bacterium]|nr:hypothetical protein [Pyrinomonadaceae bacterium]
VDKLTWIVLVDHFVRCWGGLPANGKSGKSDASGLTGAIDARIKTARIELRGRTREIPRRTFKIRTRQDVIDSLGGPKSGTILTFPRQLRTTD